MKNEVLGLVLCSVVAANSLAEEAAPRGSVDASDGRAVDLGGIVVTGEKQDRALKDTTSSVSVVREDTLETTQHLSVLEAVSDIANVVTTPGSVPTISGVNGNGGAGGFNGVSGGANARVSTLIDSVYQPFVAVDTHDFGLWDVEQIEVFRGPQSTNNGRNSIGGTMFIKTKDPVFDWEGAVRLGYRDEESYFDKAIMVSGPVVADKLALRFSGQWLNGQTTTNNQEYDTNPAGFDLNEVETRNGRLKVLWLPTDDVDVLLSYAKVVNEGDTGRRYFGLDDPYAYQLVSVRDTETETETTSLRVNYQLNAGTSLDILLSSLDYQYAFREYQAEAEAEQFAVIDEENQSIDVKLNFGQNNPALNGYVGLAGFSREQDIASTGAFVYDGADELDSQAAYGEVNVGITDQFSVTGGLRYQDETQDRRFAFPPFVPEYAELDESNDIVLPKLVLQYDVNDQTRLSVSDRKGYNSAGGALDFATQQFYFYDEETVNTYELSTHSDFTDHAITLRTHLFYNDYDGYHAQNAERQVINVDRAVTYGAEIEAVAQVTEALRLNLGVGLLNTDVKDGGADYADVKGNALDSAPKTTANLGVSYDVTRQINLGFNLHYVGDYYGDVNNTPEREIDGFTVADVTARFETGPWLVSAFINNVADEKALRAVEPASRAFPTGFADVVERRNLGVAVTYSFL
ncbi:MAG TPA: TonB-dependent receptor [Gammaproteobacteria bacterium]|nr:TonB-dependent receptor [Gammaproteobacteria bacterium]